MRLTMNEKQTVKRQFAVEYKQTDEKGKGRVFDSMIKLAGNTRPARRVTAAQGQQSAGCTGRTTN